MQAPGGVRRYEIVGVSYVLTHPMRERLPPWWRPVVGQSVEHRLCRAAAVCALRPLPAMAAPWLLVVCGADLGVGGLLHGTLADL